MFKSIQFYNAGGSYIAVYWTRILVRYINMWKDQQILRTSFDDDDGSLYELWRRLCFGILWTNVTTLLILYTECEILGYILVIVWFDPELGLQVCTFAFFLIYEDKYPKSLKSTIPCLRPLTHCSNPVPRIPYPQSLIPNPLLKMSHPESLIFSHRPNLFTTCQTEQPIHRTIGLTWGVKAVYSAMQCPSPMLWRGRRLNLQIELISIW